MRAILLAAGLGTRLRPLTNATPKCLVPIGGVPLLEIWIQKLKKCDISSCLINTHHLSSQVNDFITRNSYEKYVTICYEERLLGTCGTLLKNQEFYKGEDGFLIHADNYCLADLDEMIIAHKSRPKECLMTMMAFRTDDPSSCGIIQVDNKNVATNFYEKIDFPPGNLANGAIYLLSSEFVEIIKDNYSSAVDFSTDIIPKFMNRIYVHEVKEKLIDIGTPQMFQKANQCI